MPLTLVAMLALAQDCAPAVAPETLLSVAKVESGFDPLAIGVNGPPPRSLRPTTRADAVRTAARLIASGVSVDLGLAQINSRNLEWLGLTLEDAFDPCRNLEAAAKVLATNYRNASAGREPQAALRVALSVYNTGSRTRGGAYVGKVARAAEHIVPALQVSDSAPATSEATATQASITPSAEAVSPAWDVFAPERPGKVMVFSAPTQASPKSAFISSGDRRDP